MNPLRAKALAALREGRVTIFERTRLGVGHVHAAVASSRAGRPDHIVDYTEREWSCVTGAGECEQPCAHVAAVQLVTGFDGPARP